MTGELRYAAELVRSAGQLLLRYFSPLGNPTTSKIDQSVVTEADLAADQMIRNSILKDFPDDGLLSEELQTIFPTQKKAVWIADPLDGTTNFSLGLPIWGVSIARLVDGWPEIAAIYFPPLDELYTAQKGKGAYFQGQQMLTQSPNKKNTTTFFACCSRTHRRYDVNVPYKSRILGSAAFNMCCVARGMAVLSFEAVPKLWDLAGAWLVVQEAGAIIETLQVSQPFPPFPGKDYANVSFPTLAAPTKEYLAKGRALIKPRQERE